MVNITEHLKQKRMTSIMGKQNQRNEQKKKDLWFRLNRMAKRGHAVNVGKNASLQELEEEMARIIADRPWVMKQ